MELNAMLGRPKCHRNRMTEFHLFGKWTVAVVPRLNDPNKEDVYPCDGITSYRSLSEVEKHRPEDYARVKSALEKLGLRGKRKSRPVKRSSVKKRSKSPPPADPPTRNAHDLQSNRRNPPKSPSRSLSQSSTIRQNRNSSSSSRKTTRSPSRSPSPKARQNRNLDFFASSSSRKSPSKSRSPSPALLQKTTFSSSRKSPSPAFRQKRDSYSSFATRRSPSRSPSPAFSRVQSPSPSPTTHESVSSFRNAFIDLTGSPSPSPVSRSPSQSPKTTRPPSRRSRSPSPTPRRSPSPKKSSSGRNVGAIDWSRVLENKTPCVPHRAKTFEKRGSCLKKSDLKLLRDAIENALRTYTNEKDDLRALKAFLGEDQSRWYSKLGRIAEEADSKGHRDDAVNLFRVARAIYDFKHTLILDESPSAKTSHKPLLLEHDPDFGNSDDPEWLRMDDIRNALAVLGSDPNIHAKFMFVGTLPLAKTALTQVFKRANNELAEALSQGLSVGLVMLRSAHFVAAWFDARERRVEYFDSMSNSKVVGLAGHLSDLFDELVSTASRVWKISNPSVVSVASAKQKEGSQCGMFVVWYLTAKARGADLKDIRDAQVSDNLCGISRSDVFLRDPEVRHASTDGAKRILRFTALERKTRKTPASRSSSPAKDVIDLD